MRLMDLILPTCIIIINTHNNTFSEHNPEKGFVK
jgi:hypothetical protein